MLTLAPGTKVFLAAELVDLRRGHDGLCAVVRGVLELDPFTGFWDRGGFVIYYN